jgi:hypothetical protein
MKCLYKNITPIPFPLKPAGDSIRSRITLYPANPFVYSVLEEI